MTTTQPAWTGTEPVDDTALAVTDTGGPGRPVVYLNGAYADQSHWRRVITDLGAEFRHITYDERARGKSKRSQDYSFEACVRDVDAVLESRGVDRPILVGWSYGALLAVHWADRHPGCAGVVAVDGGVPYGITGDEARERIRRLFRRMRLLLPLVRPLGLAARMTADQHADVNIEANELHAALGPVLDRVTCPVRYVLATGANLGASQEEMEQVRPHSTPFSRATRTSGSARRSRAITPGFCATISGPSPTQFATWPPATTRPAEAGLPVPRGAASACCRRTASRTTRRLRARSSGSGRPAPMARCPAAPAG